MPVRVAFQPTPNPNAGKFVLDRKIMPPGSSHSFFTDDAITDTGRGPDAPDAAARAVARALMALPGVRSLFMVDDFVTVSKTPAATWDDLTPRVIAAIEDAL